MSKESAHPIKITDTGFNLIDTSPAALDEVEDYLVASGYMRCGISTLQRSGIGF
jgi:hypothetical protein